MYLKACGGAGFWIILICILSAVKVLGMMEVLWLKVWTAAYPLVKTTQISSVGASLRHASFKFGILRWGEHGDDDEAIDLDFYIGIYCFITLMAVFLTIV